MTSLTQFVRSRSRNRLPLTILCSLLALVFLVGAAMKFAAIDFETRNFAHFGYARWFMYLIGFVELGGAMFLMIERTRGLAALVLAATMVGAAASHLNAGDGLGMATPALIILALLLVVAYARRHALLPRVSR